MATATTNGSSSGLTLLELVEQHIAVDCDTTDVNFVKTLPMKCHDMTSNQRFIQDAIVDPKNKGLVEQAVKDGRGGDWKDTYAIIVSVERTATRVPAALQLLNPLGISTTPEKDVTVSQN